MTNRFSVLFRLRKDDVVDKDYPPIYVRVTLNGIRVKLDSTGIRVKLED